MKITDDRILMIGCGFSLTAGLAIFFDWNNGYISLARFCVALVFISFGYTLAQALLLAVFSKILDESEQVRSAQLYCL